MLQPAPQAAVADVTSEPPAVAAVSSHPRRVPGSCLGSRWTRHRLIRQLPRSPLLRQQTHRPQAEEAIVPPTSPVEAASVVAPAEAPPDPMAVVQAVVPDALPETQVSAEPVPQAAAVEEQSTEQRHQTRSPSKDETPGPDGGDGVADALRRGRASACDRTPNGNQRAPDCSKCQLLRRPCLGIKLKKGLLPSLPPRQAWNRA